MESSIMRKEMKRDLLSFIPALSAFAFCLAQDQSCADELVHSSLIEIWSTHADKKDVALEVGAFNVLRRQRRPAAATRMLASIRRRCMLPSPTFPD